jgi:hypothetical protein
MKLLFLLLAVFSLALAGCSRSAAESATHAAEAPPAAHYKAGRGLQLSPAALAFTGLATADFADGRLPAAAVLRTVKGDFVYVANDGWFLRTPVTLGAADANSFVITDGLYEGDTVVTHGARALWLAELSSTNGGVGCADGH